MDESDAEKRAEGPLVEKDMEKRQHSIAEVIEEKNIEGTVDGINVNASGHHDQLERHFSIWSLCGLALTIDNAWGEFGPTFTYSGLIHGKQSHWADHCISLFVSTLP
jgi:hypothetical protein